MLRGVSATPLLMADKRQVNTVPCKMRMRLFGWHKHVTAWLCGWWTGVIQ